LPVSMRYELVKNQVNNLTNETNEKVQSLQLTTFGKSYYFRIYSMTIDIIRAIIPSLLLIYINSRIVYLLCRMKDGIFSKEQKSSQEVFYRLTISLIIIIFCSATNFIIYFCISYTFRYALIRLVGSKKTYSTPTDPRNVQQPLILLRFDRIHLRLADTENITDVNNPFKTYQLNGEENITDSISVSIKDKLKNYTTTKALMNLITFFIQGYLTSNSEIIYENYQSVPLYVQLKTNTLMSTTPGILTRPPQSTLTSTPSIFLSTTRHTTRLTSTTTSAYPNGVIHTYTPHFSWPSVQNTISYLLWVNDYDIPNVGGRINNLYSPTEANCPTKNDVFCKVKPFVPFSENGGQWWITAHFNNGQRPLVVIDGILFTIERKTRLFPDGIIDTYTPYFSWPNTPDTVFYRLFVNDYDIPNVGGRINNLYSPTEANCPTQNDVFCKVKPSVRFSKNGGQWWITAFFANGQQSISVVNGIFFTIQ
ncbi:unnamed protein product, partial [Didymodactylos carnosus]